MLIAFIRKNFCYNYKAILFYSKALAIKHRASNKSLLFLALAYFKNLEVLVILSSEELLALVILSILRRIIVDNNFAQSLLTLILISLSYSYVTTLLRV
ncbi:hypothetical protein HBI95_197980 [Parastagonospora nodorum]|nr:hypothetical protein HBI95_197980 [Parastagonospora nodorum]KAH5244228.1 hypothetical protein HBI71_191460 [Parastagonospora nodorum]KAH5596838.1 hypothetical protein HBI45_174390 [Parastagonospora nodorum]KAH6052797.1 hypothetical protein HBI67_201000 [Parastagonospora nodorum]KAH6063743.1 hypothetical protein HBI66_176950 [Parastagonospora nodorum]